MLRDLFPRSERFRVSVVLVSGLGAALFEVLGVASISPFMALIIDPSTIERYEILKRLTTFLGAQTAQQQLVALGVLSAVTIAVGNAFSAFTLWIQHRFVSRTKRRVGAELFDGYLRQPYKFHIQRDSASLMSIVVHDADAVARLAQAALQLMSRGLVIALLLGLIFYQNAGVATGTVVVLGGSYALTYALIRRRQEALGAQLSIESAKRTRILQESFGGIKDILVLGREQEASRRFFNSMALVSRIQAVNAVVAAMPRYVLEPLSYFGVIAVAITMVVAAGGGAAKAVPTLALYAFAGYRILPSLQQMFASAVEAKFSSAAVRSLYNDWVETRDARTSPIGFDTESEASREPPRRGQSIVLSNVTFAYPQAGRNALTQISLTIRHGQSIGLVGRTGSGKSTLADLLLGLYQPTKGSLLVGEQLLTAENVRAWRARIGYVPQQVFLANATIAQNIAFGLGDALIDQQRVREAARLAQADEFIDRLPDGLQTVVGERGVKLSGGQRQRLGIARALYRAPEVLILDEATSALDGLTETAVMDAIHNLSGDRTVILVAHRLKTVEACDRILVLEEGRIVADGSYGQLLESSPAFRALAQPIAEIA